MDKIAFKLLKDGFIDIEDLVGEHVLTGVEEFYTNDANEICFVLDGISFSFLEDENDGYRSCLGSVFVSKRVVKNTFKPIKVNIVYNNDDDETIISGMVGDKVLFQVGTDYREDYYPCFVSSFRPEVLEQK